MLIDSILERHLVEGNVDTCFHHYLKSEYADEVIKKWKEGKMSKADAIR